MFKKFTAALAIALFVSTPILAQDRTFATNPPSTSGSGITYNSGTDTVTATAADGARIYSTTRPIEKGAKYTYEFTVSGYSAGKVQPYVGTVKDTFTGPNIASPVTAAANPDNPGRVPIADNFTTALGLEAAPTAVLSGDPVGAFRMFCGGGPIRPDDPMVAPNTPGGSHLHQFFGNTGVTAYSTYKSLRTSGGSTCETDQRYPIVRAAYWHPAMLDGRGGVVTSSAINIYYKRAPLGSVDCSGTATGTGICVGLPNGLQMIFGYNMGTMTADPAADVHWTCRSRPGQELTDGGDPATNARGPSYTGSSVGENRFANLKLLRDAGVCPANASIVVNAAAPACWNGTQIATTNFRSHVAFGDAPGGGAFFHGKCPTSHPYHFPSISLQINFDVDANLNTWRLSSDDQMGMGVVAGETFHTDYWEAWSPSFKADWENFCINGQLSCSEATSGNNLKLKDGNISTGRSRIYPIVRLGFGRMRSANGTYRGEFTAFANGEFGLNFLLFTGNVTGFKVTKIAKGGRGPVTTTTTQ